MHLRLYTKPTTEKWQRLGVGWMFRQHPLWIQVCSLICGRIGERSRPTICDESAQQRSWSSGKFWWFAQVYSRWVSVLYVSAIALHMHLASFCHSVGCRHHSFDGTSSCTEWHEWALNHSIHLYDNGSESIGRWRNRPASRSDHCMRYVTESVDLFLNVPSTKGANSVAVGPERRTRLIKTFLARPDRWGSYASLWALSLVRLSIMMFQAGQ